MTDDRELPAVASNEVPSAVPPDQMNQLMALKFDGAGTLQLSNMGELCTFAKIACQSRLFKDTQSLSAGIMKLYFGRAAGLTPEESLNDLFIIPGIGLAQHGRLIAKHFRLHDKYDYKVLEYSKEQVTVEFYKDGKVISMDNGQPARVTKRFETNKRNTDPWRVAPERMLFYRCIHEGKIVFCPDVSRVNLPMVSDDDIPQDMDDTQVEIQTTVNEEKIPEAEIKLPKKQKQAEQKQPPPETSSEPDSQVTIKISDQPEQQAIPLQSSEKLNQLWKE